MQRRSNMPTARQKRVSEALESQCSSTLACGNAKGDRKRASACRRHRVSTDLRTNRTSRLIHFAATQLAVAGWLAMTLPSTAATIPSSYRNQYRGCAGRLLSVGISAEAAASACAEALRPKDLSRCVIEIEQQTELAAEDALSSCRQVRRPDELASCVVGISRNQEEAMPSVLNYCGRSLLPERFAECVVGLRVEADFAPTDAMETCIDASDPLGDVAPNFVPGNQTPLSEPNSAPPGPEEQIPLIQPAPPTPAVPRDLTPLEPDPAPTEPTNPVNPGVV